MHRRPRPRHAAHTLTRVSFERRRALKWLLVPASGLLVPGAFANAGRVASARVWPAQEYTRVVFEGTTPVPHQLAAVANPPRLVLDLDAHQNLCSPACQLVGMYADDNRRTRVAELDGILDQVVEHLSQAARVTENRWHCLNLAHEADACFLGTCLCCLDGEPAGHAPLYATVEPGCLRLLAPVDAPADLFCREGIPFHQAL